MDMKEKWSKKLKLSYEETKGVYLVSEVSPKLLQEYEPSQAKSQLYGITIAEVYCVSNEILKSLQENYKKTNRSLTFKQFVEQELRDEDMTATLQYLLSVYDDSVFEMTPKE